MTAVLSAASEVDPDGLFLSGGPVTFAELDARTGAIAAGLLAEGVEPGDVVIADPGDDVIRVLGALRIGVVVTLKPSGAISPGWDAASPDVGIEPAEQAVWSETPAIVDGDARVHTHGELLLAAQEARPALGDDPPARRVMAALAALVKRSELIV